MKPAEAPMRWLLLGCGPMNVAGALCFSPVFPPGRTMLGLPEADPFYLWVLSAWILGFGVAYFYQGWTGRVNPMVLLLGAWGKAAFALLLLPRYPLAALPDLICASIFIAWLWRHRLDTTTLDETDAEIAAYRREKRARSEHGR